jgi:hypothetical protein
MVHSVAAFVFLDANCRRSYDPVPAMCIAALALASP